MILVTVGMQLGFDRLIEAMDKIAPSIDMQIIAQTGRGTYQPRNMTAREKIGPSEFEDLVQKSRLIVSHAGIGTVLTAQRFAKPIILFPRRFDHGEHRNDHQAATARNLDGRPGILVAMEEADLAGIITEGLAIGETNAALSPTAAALRDAIGTFIETGKL